MFGTNEPSMKDLAEDIQNNGSYMSFLTNSLVLSGLIDRATSDPHISPAESVSIEEQYALVTETNSPVNPIKDHSAAFETGPFLLRVNEAMIRDSENPQIGAYEDILRDVGRDAVNGMIALASTGSPNFQPAEVGFAQDIIEARGALMLNELEAGTLDRQDLENMAMLNGMHGVPEDIQQATRQIVANVAEAAQDGPQAEMVQDALEKSSLDTVQNNAVASTLDQSLNL